MKKTLLDLVGPAHLGDCVLREANHMSATFVGAVHQGELWFGKDDPNFSGQRDESTATLNAYNWNGDLMGSTSIVSNMNDAHDQSLALASNLLICGVDLDYGNGTTVATRIDDFAYGGAGSAPGHDASWASLGITHKFYSA